MKQRCKGAITDAELAELGALLFDQELKDYIDAHPDAKPEEILAHFGLPFDSIIWNDALAEKPDLVRKFQTSPNPRDRKYWSFRRDS